MLDQIMIDTAPLKRIRGILHFENGEKANSSEMATHFESALADFLAFERAIGPLDEDTEVKRQKCRFDQVVKLNDKNEAIQEIERVLRNFKNARDPKLCVFMCK